MAVAKKAPAKKTRARAPAAKKKAAAPVVAKAAPAPAARPAKSDKPKKPKLVRDSYTIPKAEYLVLEELKARAAKLGQPAKKSELLRAGLKALAAMADGAFKQSVAAVPALKTGRPAKE